MVLFTSVVSFGLFCEEKLNPLNEGVALVASVDSFGWLGEAKLNPLNENNPGFGFGEFKLEKPLPNTNFVDDASAGGAVVG